MARIQGSARPPSVLIQGETGAGKGLVAGVLCRMGPRSEGPFVEINCAAIPETLLEAELFGYERGAFTDARRAKPGLFQIAHRGALFLDEIALLPDALQAKLLKVHRGAIGAPPRRHRTTSRWTSGSSAPPMRICPPPSRSAGFARTSTTGWPW